MDLLLSIFVPVRRYRCDALGCSWEGNLRTTQRSLPNEPRGKADESKHGASAPSA